MIWLQDRRIAINVRKSAHILYIIRHIPPSCPCSFLGENIQTAEKIKYLGFTLDRITWASQARLSKKHPRDSGYSVCFSISAEDCLSGVDWSCLESSYLLWWITLAKAWCQQPIEEASLLDCYCWHTLASQQFTAAQGTRGSPYSWKHQEFCTEFWL